LRGGISRPQGIGAREVRRKGNRLLAIVGVNAIADQAYCLEDPHHLRPPTGPLVRAQVETIALMLEPQLPAVATMLRDAREEITAFADFPEAHWRKVWSTNEVDETFVGGVTPGMFGAASGQVRVMIAVEHNGGRRFGRVRMAVAERSGSLDLVEFAGSVAEPGSTIRTDGARMLKRLADMGYAHEATARYRARGQGQRAARRSTWSPRCSMGLPPFRGRGFFRVRDLA
jgi:ISXO2-like transposase domain